MKTISPKFFRSRKHQLCLLLLLLAILNYSGLFAMLLQTSITKFEYPLNEPVAEYVAYWMDNNSPIREPINHYNHSFIHSAANKCSVDSESRIRLIYLVKSAVAHSSRRNAIRKSWGFEKRFSDVEVRTVFMLAVSEEEGAQQQIDEESDQYGDVVQANFIDNYYNNTLKTMAAIRWAVEYCGRAKLYFFVDDDMYVSTKNVLRFTRNPINYPQYLENQLRAVARNKTRQPAAGRNLKQIVDIDIAEDAELFAGHVFPASRPKRHRPSKWYVSLSEYPYDYFPPYVTAGSFVLTNRVLRKFFYASFYTKHFRFDDIYLGILAKKVGVVPVHNNEFHFDKKSLSFFSYQYVIASHGYSDPEELKHVWNQQRSVGNA